MFVEQPSPGRMYPNPLNDPLDAFYDCFELKPKRRILRKDAKYEIQRAWTSWQGDKSNGSISMFLFFGWLQRNRPYFLTFRCKYDRWQSVHGWLEQYEREGRAQRGQENQ
ncbi:MAG: hypothetical protein O6941_10285 [Planctomycetota bacterium]|nr:hypothetical protein [Planctomycetota bacterium]